MVTASSIMLNRVEYTNSESHAWIILFEFIRGMVRQPLL